MTGKSHHAFGPPCLITNWDNPTAVSQPALLGITSLKQLACGTTVSQGIGDGAERAAPPAPTSPCSNTRTGPKSLKPA